MANGVYSLIHCKWCPLYHPFFFFFPQAESRLKALNAQFRLKKCDRYFNYNIIIDEVLSKFVKEIGIIYIFYLFWKLLLLLSASRVVFFSKFVLTKINLSFVYLKFNCFWIKVCISTLEFIPETSIIIIKKK